MTENTQAPGDFPLWLAHEHMSLHLKHYNPGHNVYDTVSAALASQPAQAGAVGANEWRAHLEALIDVYDDGMNNAPEHRVYVPSAFNQCIDEVRAMLAAAPTPPHAQPAAVSAIRVDVIERIASGWDGCMYMAPGEAIDIGADIRLTFSALAANKEQG